MQLFLRKMYRRYVLPRPALSHSLRPFAIFVQFLLDHVSAFPRQLLTIDLVRLLVCLPRYLLFYHVMRRRKFAPIVGLGVSGNTIEHNMRGTGELSAPRSHTLIRPIVTIGFVQRNIRSLKVLTIGPRVEGEIYNLIGYGFKARNIVGLDLFSYSPYIQVGDMHDMEFADDTFDVIISGWVLGYSDDKSGCAREMLRVLKPGGVIAIGNAHTLKDHSGVADSLGYTIGAKETISDLPSVERLFGVTSENCYFRYDGSPDGVEGSPMITVFQAKRQLAGALPQGISRAP